MPDNPKHHARHRIRRVTTDPAESSLPPPRLHRSTRIALEKGLYASYYDAFMADCQKDAREIRNILICAISFIAICGVAAIMALIPPQSRNAQPTHSPKPLPTRSVTRYPRGHRERGVPAYLAP